MMFSVFWGLRVSAARDSKGVRQSSDHFWRVWLDAENEALVHTASRIFTTA